MSKKQETFAINGEDIQTISVTMNSPSSRNALQQLSDNNDSKAVREALITAASQTDSTIDDAETALTHLLEEWGTNKSETVREALRHAASEVQASA